MSRATAPEPFEMETARHRMPPPVCWTCAAICAACLFLPMVARAELTDESLFGPGARSRPAYDGSDSQVLELVPVIRYLGEPWFVRTTQEVLEGGVRRELAPGVHAGAQLAYEPGRNTEESSFLRSHRVPYIDRGLSVGTQLEWDHMFGPMPITLLGRLRQDANLNLGGQADLRLSAGIFQSGPVAAGLFTQATWADARSANSFYGITAQESLATDLRTFHAGSGWLSADFGFLASVDLSSKWSIDGSGETRHLYGDAARSPLTERAANFYLSLGLVYRF